VVKISKPKYQQEGHFSKVDYQELVDGRVTHYLYDPAKGDWVSLAQVLESKLAFIDLVFTKLTGRYPTEDELRLLQANLVIVSMGTGPHAPSVMIAKLISSTTKDERFAAIDGLIGGLASMGTHHLGAVYDVMKFYEYIAEKLGGVPDFRLAVRGYAKAELIQGDKLMGYGHPVYDEDPRNSIILDLVRKVDATSTYLQIYEEIESLIWEEKSIHPNIDAAQALAYLVLGFRPIHGIYLNFLGRSLDMICHIEEEFGRKPFSFLMESSPPDRFYKKSA